MLNTFESLPYQKNTEIILKRCPLYDQHSNEEIFRQVHNFIKNSKRF